MPRAKVKAPANPRDQATQAIKNENEKAKGRGKKTNRTPAEVDAALDVILAHLSET